MIVAVTACDDEASAPADADDVSADSADVTSDADDTEDEGDLDVAEDLGPELGATRTVDCEGLPDGAIWNTVDSIEQEWDGSEWLPDSAAHFSPYPSTTECVYACDPAVTRLTFYSFNDLDGDFDGDPNPSFNVWVVNGDGSDLTPLTEYAAPMLWSAIPAFSPDGTKIAYNSFGPLDGAWTGDPVARNVWIMDSDGSNRTPITRHTEMAFRFPYLADGGYYSWMPVFSPDGETVYYTSTTPLDGSWDGDPTGSHNIWAYDVSEGTVEPVTRNTGSGLDSILPRTSADGEWLIFPSRTDLAGDWDGTPTESWNVWVMLLEIGTPVRVTENTGAGYDSVVADLHSVPNVMAFDSFTDLDGDWDGTGTGSANIWIAVEEGIVPATRNTLEGLDSTFPEISPDGSRIVFVSSMPLEGGWDGTPSRSTNLWIMDADGENMTPLTRNTEVGLDIQRPAFSPDGSMIAFTSWTALDGTWNGTPTASPNVWVMRVDGSEMTPLTQNSGENLESWDMDGRAFYQPATCRDWHLPRNWTAP